MRTAPPMVFGTPSYANMQRGLCDTTGWSLAHVETRAFPDGERYQRIEDDVQGRDVVIVGGTVTDEDTLRIYDLACSIAKYGARSLTLVVPYFGYSTMERAVKPGEVVTAKSRARLLSSIPTAHAGNNIVMIDLHAAGLPYYLEGAIRAVHLYARPITLQAIRQLGGASFCLASPDAGRTKWVESLANDLGVPGAFILKRRLSGTHTEVTAINADVRGSAVVIYDDMIRSGGTLLKAAAAYLDAGATQVAAVATHGVFPGDALSRLRDSGLLTGVACTDTHPRAQELAAEGAGFLTVHSVVPLVAECLESLYPEHTDHGRARGAALLA